MLVSDYSIKFRTAVFVFVVVLVLMGAFSYVTLPREGAPDITIPYVFITSVYEGVAPEDVENLITIPLEKKLNDLANVKEMRSSSAEGVSVVTIEFTPEQDIDGALQKVKDKIDLAKPDLPNDLDEPTVTDINFSTDIPILVFAVSGKTTLERLKSLAEELEDRIEEIPGVLQASVMGAREREIRVEVDLNRLMAYRLPVSALVAALYGENATVSAGNLEFSTGRKFQIRVPGEFASVNEIGNIVVAMRDGRPLYLRDLASVSDGYKDVSSISRVNGEPCVSVSVQKRTGQNSVAIIDEVKEVLDRHHLPPGIELTVTNDQSRDIRMMISELENNVASGFILVVVVLLIFMGARNSFLVALAIPFSMLISFTVLKFYGITLNMIVLFSLVLALGMLVDNAIVIVENIFRHHSEGEGKLDAARNGASEVAWPVITSTLTTLAAFSPLLFWPGVMGQFMGFLPRTLICTLTASLFVAIVINPAICSVVIRRAGRVGSPANGRRHRFVAGYEAFLRFALRNRLAVMLLSLVCLIVSFVMFGIYGRGVELFPETDPRTCSVTVKYPEGTSIDKVDETLRTVERQCLGYEDVEFVLSTAGATGGFFGGEQGTHVGQVSIRFVDFDKRRLSSARLVERIRHEMAVFPGAEVSVEKEKEGPPTGAPVSIEISGEDFGRLAELADEVKRRVATVPGLADLQDDVEDSRPEFQFHVDRERAALLGLNTRYIGQFIRSVVNGQEATKFRAGEDEYDITIRLPEAQRDSAALFDRILVPSPDGRTVALSSLGRVRYAGGRGAIRRKDRKRTVTVTGNNADGVGVDAILADVRQRLSDMELPPGYAIAFAGDTKEMRESGEFLAKAFAVALALIVIILVLQFNSVLLPLVIMVSVVLSLVGVMWGLIVCRMRFGVIMTGLGVISLAGIVVNNAIVLIDCIEGQLRRGVAVVEAIVAAGRLRLRPVLLTAGTTVLGLIPMAIGYSLEVHTMPPRLVSSTETSAWWAPMAVAVIFGLVVATVLTLVLVPVMFSLSDTLVRGARWYFGRRETPRGIRPLNRRGQGTA